MQIFLDGDEAGAVKRVIAKRISDIDDTECNNSDVANQMQDERWLLIRVLGEITVAECRLA